MAHYVIDRARQQAAAGGTSAFNLVSTFGGFVPFSERLAANGDTTWYCATAGATEWEIGLGTRASASVLERTTVISSSNAGALVNFSAAPEVFSTVPAARMPFAQGPTFRAYRSGNQGVSNGAWTKIAFNAETFDVGGCFDTANSRFQPAVPGVYRFEAAFLSASSGSITDIALQAYKNGATYCYGVYGLGGSASRRTGVADQVLMQAGDYLEMYAYLTGSGTLSIAGVQYETRFSASLVTATG